MLVLTWKAPPGKAKEGDAAEDFVMDKLTKSNFLDLLQEPVFLISGQMYCYIKTEQGEFWNYRFYI